MGWLAEPAAEARTDPIPPGSLCGPGVAQALPAQAASLPAPRGASPSRGQGQEEDYADSLMDKIGSQAEGPQGGNLL